MLGWCCKLKSAVLITRLDEYLDRQGSFTPDPA